MKSLKSIPLIILMALLVIFAVANRQSVVVSLWPFPWEAGMPLFFVLFLGIFIGLGLAAIIMTIKGVRHRSALRSAEKESSRLSGEVETLEGELDKKPAKVDQKDYSENAGTTKLAKKNKRP